MGKQPDVKPCIGFQNGTAHCSQLRKTAKLAKLCRMKTVLPFLTLLLLSQPANAWSGTQIPEPSNLALFGLGLTGLIIGRQISKRKNRSDDK